MRPRSITVRSARITATTEMIVNPHDPGSAIEDGVYLHRDDICDIIRSIGGAGHADLPEMATAVPGWIAEKIRLLP